MHFDASFITLIEHSSPFVKGIMTALLILSLLSWMLIVERLVLFYRSRCALIACQRTLEQESDVKGFYEHLIARGSKAGPVERVLRAAFERWLKLRRRESLPTYVLVESSQQDFEVASHAWNADLNRTLPYLATVASISPFIGLLGTVWGIMVSFKALGAVSYASLTMVAPGISEALIATAMGLMVAIPASLFYNLFCVWADAQSQMMHRMGRQCLNWVQLNVHLEDTQGDAYDA